MSMVATYGVTADIMSAWDGQKSGTVKARVEIIFSAATGTATVKATAGDHMATISDEARSMKDIDLLVRQAVYEANERRLRGFCWLENFRYGAA